MLKLILGRQQSGKTYNCLSVAESAVNMGKDVIFIVPEQYSFECQRMMLDAFGSKISNKIEIHSFTSLCEAICDVYGGVAGINVDESTRFILVGQALKSIKDSLKMYGKYASSTSFIKEILSIITELKQSGITSEALLELSDKTDSESLSRKLNDFSLILNTYDAVMANRFIDPLDLIDRTVNSMTDNSFFSNKTVIIDEFKGFTESQYKLLDRIIAASDDTYISLCCDSLNKRDGLDIFNSVKISAERLIKIAESHSVSVAKPLYTEYYDGISPEVAFLEALTCEKEVDTFTEKPEKISIFQADNVIGEVDHVMKTIRRLVMDENKDLRYRDFVIISRSDNVYSKLIEESSKLYGIPCYTDTRIPLTQLPLSALIMSAVKAALDIDTEVLLRVAKTGLVGLSENEISDLENYAYIWNISGKKWLADWDMNPDGLKEVPENKIEAVNAKIKEINNLRSKLVEPISRLRANLNGSAENMCTGLFKYLEECKILEYLRDYANSLESDGRLLEAEYQRTGYDVFVKVIDKIVAAVGDNSITAKEFSDILNASIKFETVGEIPKLKDQVIYGTADRIRPFRPKIAFVIGVNQDVFPALISSGGLLTQNDRKILNDNKLKVSDHSINDSLDEKLLFYFACSYASEGVYISYSNTSITGNAMKPSPEISLIKKHFQELEIIEQSNDFSLDSAETYESTFRDLARNFKADNNVIEAVKAYFAEKDDYKPRIESIKNYLETKSSKITEESALDIYGDKVALSASKVDDFVDCKFLYFCKYGLQAGKLERVEFNPMTRGKIVHYCLEMFINNHKSDVGDLCENAIGEEIREYIDDYLRLNNVDETYFDEKFKFMLRIVSDTAVSLAVALNKEFKVNQFKPLACELEIGENGVVKGIDIYTNKGHLITLNGYIDRVDVTDDGKVRVVDYKSGSKGDKFNVSEIYNGHNLQMILYLYALMKNGNTVTNASVPAGVLYFPAKRHVAEEKSDYIKMNGLVLKDVDTVKQMEPSGRGEIIPPKITDKGVIDGRCNNVATLDTFNMIFAFVERTLQQIGSSLMNGDIIPEPMDIGSNKTKCDYCDYHSICRYDFKKGAKERVSFRSCNTAYKAMEEKLKEMEDADNGN